jgi:hypothetical protein
VQTDLNWTLDECQMLLCLQETDLEVREVILAEEQACGMHPLDGQNLSVELGKTHTRVDRINDERAAEAC